MSITDKCVPCAECGGVDVTRRVYEHTEKVGRWTTTDGTALVEQCGSCSAPRLSLEQLTEYQLSAVKTVLCEGHAEGAVIRYARKALGLTQKELGLILDYQHETVSKWENDKDKMQRSAIQALIGILCRALNGEAPEDLLNEARQGVVACASGDLIEVRSRRVG